MEKSAIIVVLVCVCVCVTSGTLVRINTELSGWYYGNISGKIISRNNLPRKWWRTETGLGEPSAVDYHSITELHVLRYSNGDSEINILDNLPTLIRLDVQNVAQTQQIFLYQLPNLKEIWMEDNRIRSIDNEAISTTGVTSIYLSNNEIVSIQDGSFGTEMTRVELPCNRLRYIRSEWFLKPSVLQFLDLTGNSIDVIPALFFRSFTSLRSIFLSFNHLHTIGVGAFAGRDNFFWLRLGYNRLLEIKTDTFLPWNVTIGTLDVQNNWLTYLPRDLIKRLTIEENALVEGNPWQCPCYFNQISTWLKSISHHTQRDQRSNPICGTIGRKNCVEEISSETNSLVSHYINHTTSGNNSKYKFCSCLKKKKDRFYCYDYPEK